MVVGAGKDAVLAVDAVGHEKGAEVRILVEGNLLHVLLHNIEQLSEDFLSDVSYFLQFGQPQSTGVLPTCQVGVMVYCLSLYLAYLPQFQSFPPIVVVPSLFGSGLSYLHIGEVVESELNWPNLVHEDFLIAANRLFLDGLLCWDCQLSI